MHETEETQFQSLGWENPLEEEMVTYSSTFALKILQTEEPSDSWQATVHRVTESDMTEVT